MEEITRKCENWGEYVKDLQKELIMIRLSFRQK